MAKIKTINKLEAMRKQYKQQSTADGRQTAAGSSSVKIHDGSELIPTQPKKQAVTGNGIKTYGASAKISRQPEKQVKTGYGRVTQGSTGSYTSENRSSVAAFPEEQKARSKPNTVEKTIAHSYSKVRQNAADKKQEHNSVIDWANSGISLLNEMQAQVQKWSYKDSHAAYSRKISSLLSEADTWRKQYEGNDEAISYIDSVVSALSELEKAASDVSTYYAQWDSEDAYNQALAAYRLVQEQLAFDVEAGEKELEELETLLNDADRVSSWYTSYQMNPGAWSADMVAANMEIYESLQANGGKETLQQTVEEKRTYLNAAKELQERAKFESVADPTSENYDPEFVEKSRYISTKYDGLSWDSIFNDQYGLGYADLTYEYINGAQNGMRDEINRMYSIMSRDNAWSDGESIYEENAYDYMEADEIAIYNYFYSTAGKETAEKYLSCILGTLRARKAGVQFGNLEGKLIPELLFGIVAGIDQFSSGIQNFFHTEGDYITPTTIQMVSGMVREDLQDVDLKWYNIKEGQWKDADIFGSSLGQLGYDAVTTTANMAPSILASTAIGMFNPTAGMVVGNTLLATSAAGNAYQEKLNLGYSKEEARTYGFMVGASEATLQLLLGGIGKLGKNVLTSTVLKNLDAVDDVFARFAKSAGGKFALNGISEGFEEGLQTVIEPFLWQAVSGVEATIDWQETLYNSLMGFVISNVFNGVDSGINASSENARFAAPGQATSTQNAIIQQNPAAESTQPQQTASTNQDLLLQAEAVLRRENLSVAQISALNAYHQSVAKIDVNQQEIYQLEKQLQAQLPAANKSELRRIQANIDMLKAKNERILSALRKAEDTVSLRDIINRTRDQLQKGANQNEDIKPDVKMQTNVLDSYQNSDILEVDGLKSYEEAYANREIITDGSHMENGKLKPNIVFRAGEHRYLYETDSQGRIINVCTDHLKKKSHEGRLQHNPNTPGKEYGDHAGHLIGDRFGGSNDLDNLVSMAKDVNLSEFAKLENLWAKGIENHPGQVGVSIQIHYDEGSRPIAFTVQFRIADQSFQQTIVNVNHGP